MNTLISKIIIAIFAIAVVSCNEDKPNSNNGRIPVSGVNLDASELDMLAGEEATLTAFVLPEDATNQDIRWENSDAKVVKVVKGENGKAIVTALSEGKATVYVTTVESGFRKSCAINVTEKKVPLTGIAIEPRNLSIVGIDFTEKLTPIFTPADASNKSLSWFCDNEFVAEIAADGTVTAKETGTAKIFVVASDGGHTASCDIRVSEENAATAEQFATNVRNYLNANYTSAITEVNAEANTITVTGYCAGAGDFSLCEIPPYYNITQLDYFPYSRALSESSFSETFDRYVVRNGFTYDRTLSKWVIVKHNDGNKDEMVSHARYPDIIHASRNLFQQKPTSKKGLGGFFNHATQRQDLNDLGITSVTVNVAFTGFMRSSSSGSNIQHSYGGRTYYFDTNQINTLDATLKACSDRGIVVAAILLVQPAANCLDKNIGALLQHPDYAGGHYTMPNMTNPESVNTYAAALDFLANRYCNTSNQYGRIHHWIMHNEVDAHLEWTDMGANKPMLTYTDAYMKSMRMCYNIVRRYDQNAEVFGSFTHSWRSAVISGGYTTYDMLQAFNDYCNAEGDFQWALAHHPYPQSLLEPRTWNDARATYSTSTQLVTFKNLEVLSHWAKQPENQYNGSTKRTVWLSENGTNSRSYSENDLRDQAAGFAWAWKKLKNLDGIDAMQWHNWYDHPTEAAQGLRIGLRTDQLVQKEVWFTYQAAGTTNEDNDFQKYLSVIGISDWNIIQNISN